MSCTRRARLRLADPSTDLEGLEREPVRVLVLAAHECGAGPEVGEIPPHGRIGWIARRGARSLVPEPRTRRVPFAETVARRVDQRDHLGLAADPPVEPLRQLLRDIEPQGPLVGVRPAR